MNMSNTGDNVIMVCENSLTIIQNKRNPTGMCLFGIFFSSCLYFVDIQAMRQEKDSNTEEKITQGRFVV